MKKATLTRIWEGQDCYILGPGLSLPRQFGVPEDIIEGVQSGTLPLTSYRTYFEALKNKNVIGLDAAYAYGDWVDVVFFWDHTFYSAHRRRGLDIHPALKVSTCDRFRQDPSHGVVYVKEDTRQCGISVEENTVSRNYNSGAAAINLAFQLGVKRAILLGFDYPAISLSHFAIRSQQTPGKPANFENFMEAFTRVNEDAQKLGMEIINVSDEKILPMFQATTIAKLFGAKSILKKDKIALITPTCSAERKPLLEFVKKRMAEQTHKADMHIIIDRPNSTGKSDLTARYREGLDKAFKAGCTFALLIEDDDYYPIDYVEKMYEFWKRSGKPHLVGQKTSYYYHLFTRGFGTMKPKTHTSAHCTGVASDADYAFVCSDENPYFDIQIWKRNNGVFIELEKPVISIKHGLGICGGRGHTGYEYRKFDDLEYSQLKQLVDDEAFQLYMKIIKENDPVCAEYYDKIFTESAEYAKTDPAKSIYHKLYLRVNELIEEDQPILELGCGTGLLAKVLLDAGKKYKRGWDFSEVGIQRAKEINPDHASKFAVGDITRIPMRRVHTIVSLEVLEHLKDDLELIKRLPECTFIFSVPDFLIPCHQRAFKNEREVEERYGSFLEIASIEKLQITPANGVYLVKSYKR